MVTVSLETKVLPIHSVCAPWLTFYFNVFDNIPAEGFEFSHHSQGSLEVGNLQITTHKTKKLRMNWDSSLGPWERLRILIGSSISRPLIPFVPSQIALIHLSRAELSMLRLWWWVVVAGVVQSAKVRRSGRRNRSDEADDEDPHICLPGQRMTSLG